MADKTLNFFATIRLRTLVRDVIQLESMDAPLPKRVVELAEDLCVG